MKEDNISLYEITKIIKKYDNFVKKANSIYFKNEFSKLINKKVISIKKSHDNKSIVLKTFDKIYLLDISSNFEVINDYLFLNETLPTKEIFFSNFIVSISSKWVMYEDKINKMSYLINNKCYRKVGVKSIKDETVLNDFKKIEIPYKDCPFYIKAIKEVDLDVNFKRVRKRKK